MQRLTNCLRQLTCKLFPALEKQPPAQQQVADDITLMVAIRLK